MTTTQLAKKIILPIWFLAFIYYPLSGQQQRVLLYTEYSGFNHGTQAASLSMFNSIGAARGFTVTWDSTSSLFTTTGLDTFDIVVFANTRGNNILTAAERTALENYMNNGGRFLGIHAASDTYRHSSANVGGFGVWDWFAENLTGASPQPSPNHTQNNLLATINISNTASQIVAMIPDPWLHTDEYYYWENGYLNDSNFIEILRVQATGVQSYDSARMVAHINPSIGNGGRAFYTALGHDNSEYTSNPDFYQLIFDAVGYLLGEFDAALEIPNSDPLDEKEANNFYLATSPEKGKYAFHIQEPANLQWALINMEGKVLFRSPTHHATNQMDIDTSLYPSGLFVIKIYNDGIQIFKSRITN